MRTIIATFLILVSSSLSAQQVDVRSARIWTAPDHTKLVVDTAAAVTHKVFSLDNPDRLVVDIPDARLTAKLPVVEADDPLLSGVRSGIRAGDDLRLVLDLKQPVRAKSFMLEPNDQSGHRLVVDLTPKGSAAEAATGKGEHLSVRTAPKKAREVVVAIDAGHGGEDPGAIGAAGTREKQITMAIARKLAQLVKKERGMRPVLIRDGDYFVSLRKRIALARKHQADLFVSIHADAFNDPRVRGSSVYTLSHRGASSEAAKWLADKENSADLIGGIDVGENSDLLHRASGHDPERHARAQRPGGKQGARQSQQGRQGPQEPGAEGGVCGPEVPGHPVHAGRDGLHLESGGGEAPAQRRPSVPDGEGDPGRDQGLLRGLSAARHPARGTRQERGAQARHRQWRYPGRDRAPISGSA